MNVFSKVSYLCKIANDEAADFIIHLLSKNDVLKEVHTGFIKQGILKTTLAVLSV